MQFLNQRINPLYRIQVLLCFSADWLKILRAVFAYRTDKIRRKYIAFVNISADFADKTFLFQFCFRSRFNMIEIVLIGHRRNIGKNLFCCHISDKHHMRSEINTAVHLYGNHRKMCIRDSSIPVDCLIQLAEFYHTSIDYMLGLTDEKRPYPKSKSI